MRVDKAIELVRKFTGEFIDSIINLDLNKRIGEAYTEYKEDKLVDITTQVLQEWINLSKTNPQAIIDEGRNLIAQNTNLTTLLAHWKKINQPAYSTKSQMEALSAYYELASLLTFPVSVMTLVLLDLSAHPGRSMYLSKRHTAHGGALCCVAVVLFLWGSCCGLFQLAFLPFYS